MKYEIKGTPFPVVICQLEAGETMLTERGSMSWMTPNMKMETTFVSKVNGKVDKLYVAPGDRVNTEDLLISFVLDEEEEK